LKGFIVGKRKKKHRKRDLSILKAFKKEINLSEQVLIPKKLRYNRRKQKKLIKDYWKEV